MIVIVILALLVTYINTVSLAIWNIELLRNRKQTFSLGNGAYISFTIFNSMTNNITKPVKGIMTNKKDLFRYAQNKRLLFSV